MIKENSIAFFWVGDDLKIPQYLVNSIRLVMGSEINIVQLTDMNTNKVESVSSVKRFSLSKNIMVARLEAYSSYIPETNNVLFCDADSIFINKIVFPDGKKNIFLSPRIQNFQINYNYPEYYEEFVNKSAQEVMPFLFGAIATKKNQQEFFRKILRICLSLPERFHRWYGDQFALSLLIKQGFNEFETMDTEKYLNILREPLTPKYLENAFIKGVQLITFKGPQSKAHLEQANNLLEYYFNKSINS